MISFAFGLIIGLVAGAVIMFSLCEGSQYDNERIGK